MDKSFFAQLDELINSSTHKDATKNANTIEESDENETNHILERSERLFKQFNREMYTNVNEALLQHRDINITFDALDTLSYTTNRFCSKSSTERCLVLDTDFPNAFFESNPKKCQKCLHEATKLVEANRRATLKKISHKIGNIDYRLNSAIDRIVENNEKLLHD